MKEVISADLETFLISADAVAPKPVVLSYCVGDATKVIHHDQIEETIFELLSNNDTLTWHNAKFDMTVLWVWYPHLRDAIFNAYRDGRIKCTLIREKLLELSTSGQLNQRDYYSLADCMLRNFEEDISEWKHGEDAWRLRFGELYDRPLSEYPEKALEYCRLDVQWGKRLYEQQEERRQPSGENSMGTENLQTITDFILGLITIRGMKVDPVQVEKLAEECINGLAAPEQILKEEGVHVTRQLKRGPKTEWKTFGYEDKTGKFRMRTKLIQDYTEEKYPGKGIRSEKTQKLSLSKEGLIELPKDPVLDCLRDMAEYSKVSTTYLPALQRAVEARGVIHPNFDVLKTTGRTSSHGGKLYPSFNAQNLPRKGDVRRSIVARKGMVIVAIDYDSLELRSLAQVNYELFGFSKMLDYLNAGNDPHSAMGAQLLSVKEERSVSYDEFISRLGKGEDIVKEFRQLSKAANFGFPGGLGGKAMMKYAQNYGIADMDIATAEQLKVDFFKAFPEMVKFFEWHRTKQDNMGFYHYDTNGRWRANCSYCAAANGINLQSLSADGAKIALIRLFEACFSGALQGCYIINTVHDENLMEMPDDDKLTERIEVAMTLMIEGMSAVIPDVRIGVGAQVMKRWVKSGEEILGEHSLALPPKNQKAAKT